ncbi:MAG: NlpC/P60 family protein [Chitinophagaceae bacterium]
MTCRIFVYVTAILIFVSSCSAPKQSTSSRKNDSSSAKVVNKNPKFLDDISVDPGSSTTTVNGNRQKSANNSSRNTTNPPNSYDAGKAFPLQLKYAMLLNAEVQDINNERLFQFIDDWYGTRYCMGGTSKTCIDCSGFVQTFFSSVYGISIPRTSKEQYSFASRISSKKLREGDLVFFNTRGGVSHVGIYLMNNKFVHASTSLGVVISGLDEAYYHKHFIGAGRIVN